MVSDFTALVGREPLPPLFAMGYQQCRYSYYPEARVREVAGEFRKRKIPADVIYLDAVIRYGLAVVTTSIEALLTASM